MPKVIFRFDTEDYVNLQAADGVLNAIKPLNEAGIKGTFVVVAKFAEELKRLGRTDIIDALKEHDIGTHSYGHSLHPTLNEYTDLEDYDEALRIFNETESMGNEILKDVFGIDEIKTYCGPGASISYFRQNG
jgi:peptidoglycan/xylan/chitin deacetylase (PgdA/CDA1 family)